MKLAFVVALVTLAGLSMLFAGSPVADSVTLSQRRDIHGVAQYRMFSYATKLYLDANLAFAGTLSWSDLAGSDSTPPSMRNAQMPASFKAVVASATDYVVCGELSEQAATALSQFMPASVKAFNASGDKIVLAVDQATADTEAARCN